MHQILTIKSLQDLIVLSEMLSDYYRISNEVFPNSKEKSYFTILTILFAQKEKTIFKGMLIYKFLKKNQDLDQASGVIMPHYDESNNVLYLAGKGDGNIRYFEITDKAPYCFSISDYRSSTSQKGLCFLPKRNLIQSRI